MLCECANIACSSDNHHSHVRNPHLTNPSTWSPQVPFNIYDFSHTSPVRKHIWICKRHSASSSSSAGHLRQCHHTWFAVARKFVAQSGTTLLSSSLLSFSAHARPARTSRAHATVTRMSIGQKRGRRGAKRIHLLDLMLMFEENRSVVELGQQRHPARDPVSL